MKARLNARSDKRSLVIVALAIAVIAPLVVATGMGVTDVGYIEAEVHSDFSHIRIRRYRNVRTMIFVRDSGEEAMESQVDLSKPYELRFNYLKYMFLSHVFRAMPAEDDKLLIVGLGGGSMVHFLRRYDPDTQVDVVEIDPVVVQLAERYFAVRSSDKVNIVTEDAFKFLRESEDRYRVIYLDAFLKPSADTDSTGVPVKLRTQQFYQSLRKNLTPDGLVVFNINPHAQVAEDVSTIRSAFPQTYVFSLPGSSGLVVVASLNEHREAKNKLLGQARLTDRRLKASYSFETMIRRWNGD